MSKLIASRGAEVYRVDDPNVAIQFPLWGKGKVVRYWAERGMVHWEDSDMGAYDCMTWQDAAHRTLALSEMTLNSTNEGLKPDEILRIKVFIERMERVIRQAKSQGGPLDDVAGIAEEHRRRRTKRVYVPEIANSPLEFAPARPARAEQKAKKKAKPATARR
jgi:hypothetical protein